MLPIVMFVAMFSNFFGSYLLKIRWTTPRNHVLFFGSLGISGCYLSTLIETKFKAFMYLYTVSFGLVVGATYMTAVSVAWQYFPGKEGILSGIIIGGFGLGGFIFPFLS
jgi:hypothetical protein